MTLQVNLLTKNQAYALNRSLSWGTGLATANKAGGTNNAVAPSIPVSANSLPTKGSDENAVVIPSVVPKGLAGVGGPLTVCRLAMVGSDGKPSGVEFVDFEMAPARRSFIEKQAQSVPGAGAGLETDIKTSLAKLNVPGSRPLYQAMGILEETIEFVGAFIGYDEYMGEPDGTKPVWDNSRVKSSANAWEKAQKLAYAVRAQREMYLQIAWGDALGLYFSGNGSTNLKYRGYIKSVKRSYATAQRVYYHIVMCVTNRDDVNNTDPASSGGVQVVAPIKLDWGGASSSETAPAASSFSPLIPGQLFGPYLPGRAPGTTPGQPIGTPGSDSSNSSNGSGSRTGYR